MGRTAGGHSQYTSVMMASQEEAIHAQILIVEDEADHAEVMAEADDVSMC